MVPANLNHGQDTRANRTRHTSSSTQSHAKQQHTNATHVHTSRSHAHAHPSRHTPSATPTRERTRQGNHRLRDLHRPLRQRLRPLTPSLKHRATMPLALSMALAWYTTSLPLSHNPILNPCAPSSLYAVLRYVPFVLSFYVPCAPSSFSMFLYVCSFYVRAPCVVPGAPCLYFGRYS